MARVSDARFVQVFCEGVRDEIGIDAVAKLLGMKGPSVGQRASQLRNPAKKKVRLDDNGKPVKVEGVIQYDPIPVEKRAVPVPLPHMPKGRSTNKRTDALAALEAFNNPPAADEDEGETADVAAPADAPTETVVNDAPVS